MRKHELKVVRPDDSPEADAGDIPAESHHPGSAITINRIQTSVEEHLLKTGARMAVRGDPRMSQ